MFVDFALGRLGKAGFDQAFSNFLCLLFITFGFVIHDDGAQKFRGRHIFHCLVKAGEIGSGSFANIGNGEGIKPARKRERSRTVDRLDCLGRIFLPENARRFVRAEIQLCQLIDFELEQVEWLSYQSTLNQFVGHDSADTVDIECAPRCEKFQATSRLRWTT